MSVYAIGDLHLSQTANKSMEVFAGWENYTQRIQENWRAKISPCDTVILAGDTSWGMSLQEALEDFRLIHALPGKKVILKGNHDYWWTSVTKMNRFLEDNCIDSIFFLHNNSYCIEDLQICGSRGWLFENGEQHDEKIVKRETCRIVASLKSAGDSEKERLLFLHYPPLYGSQVLKPFIDAMTEYGIKRCYYGHIHGAGCRSAIEGDFYGIRFQMISSDYLRFDPVLV